MSIHTSLVDMIVRIMVAHFRACTGKYNEAICPHHFFTLNDNALNQLSDFNWVPVGVILGKVWSLVKFERPDEKSLLPQWPSKDVKLVSTGA